MTKSERQAVMDRARAKRRRQTEHKHGPTQLEGVVGQVKDLAAGDARTVGAVVVAATAALRNVSNAGTGETPDAESVVAAPAE